VILVFGWLKDFLQIYTWKEFWIVMSVPTVILGFWFLFCLLLSIPVIIIKAIAIWALLIILMLGSVTVDVLRKRQNKV
jgi:hypothetical protein